MSKEDLWQAVLARVQLNISPANFATWFKNTGILNQKGEEIVISVPNSFAKEWLEQKYNKMIFKTLHELSAGIKDIKYVVDKQELKVVKKDRVFLPTTDQLEFPEFKIDKETNLNPRYAFENFIVGPFNELPHAAALAVSREPGSVYNPLFVYGGVGLGKTHLIQAVGNAIIKNFSDKKVRYTSAEKFTSGVISSIRNHEMEKFKSQYRQIDALIIDDIQFLAGKEKTQEEFFHTFNSLYEKNKQIIVSSDRPPKTIPSLAERLRSRFEGGMIADIGAPDFETRVAILKSKIKERGMDFPDEILNYVANNVQKNIRELEGALNKLAAYQKLNNQSPDVETAKTILKSIVLSLPHVSSPKKIIKAVAEFYDLKENDILMPSRKREVVYPRQVAMYLMRKELKNSYPAIGRKFKGKDHTTAIHSCEKIERELRTSEKLSDEISLIKQQIYNQ